MAPACTFIRDYLPGSPFVATPRMETSLKSYCVRPVRSLLHSWLPSPSIFLSLSLHHHSAAATSAPLSHYSFDGHSHSPLPASAKNRNELGRDCSLHDMRYARNFLIITLWSDRGIGSMFPVTILSFYNLFSTTPCMLPIMNRRLCKADTLLARLIGHMGEGNSNRAARRASGQIFLTH